MKEAPTKSLPPKISAVSSSGDGTPVKNASGSSYARGTATNDEILSTLLRINNFDSISSIKDESLDIDLSACVTISDPSGIINGNSLSTSDFWRVLDESAQTSGQLDMSCTISGDELGSSASNILEITTSNEANLALIVKSERPSSFSGTFLRPEPPSLLMSISPLKKSAKAYTTDHFEKHVPKPKIKTMNPLVADHILTERKKAKLMSATAALMVKQEPPEQLLADDDSVKGTYSSESSEDLSSMISRHSFSLIVSPVKKNTCSANSKQETAEPSVSRSGSENNRPVTGIEPKSSSSADAVAEESTAPAPPSEPHFKCEDCGGLVLQGLQEYAIHEALSHKILHKCIECQKLFENEAGLKKHVKAHRTVESRKDAWKKCPDCGKCLKLGSMWMHRKIHSDNKKYGCDICGQKFVQKINLTHHSRVHTSEKPYECPECQKRFQERSHLQRHQKYHAQTRSYRCEKCGKMYKTERCLKVHNLVHLEQRPFACNVCDKSFISNSKLKQHSNIHTGERPFKCNYCPRDFTNFPNWLKHTRRRHKVDHKTGEHLENIPSYCSKKSSKSSSASAKAEKTQPPSITKTSTLTQQPVPILEGNDARNGSESFTAKPQPKRKKKITPLQPESAAIEPTVQSGTLNEVTGNPQTIPTPLANNVTAIATVTAPTKVVKVKRERKQSTPKQVHKPSNPAPIIKKEVVDFVEHAIIEQPPTTKAETTHFPDLHCLSITSAEELIMEQALEMEECGLYDAPASSNALDTDNAVSAESAAALRFQIKNEFIDIKEEYLTLAEGANNRVLCSSLESSPYSSPASTNSALQVAVTNVSTTTARVLTQQMSTPTTSASYYMPPFGLSTTGATVNSNSQANSSTVITMTTTTNEMDTTLDALEQPVQQGQRQQQQQRITPLTNAQAVLSQLYVPVTMNMPLLIPQLSTTHQVLPSVNTLLFTHANAEFFRGKSAASATAHNNL